MKKAFTLLFILLVLHCIIPLSALDYLWKLATKKPEKFWEIVGKSYGYWGMVFALNTHARR